MTTAFLQPILRYFCHTTKCKNHINSKKLIFIDLIGFFVKIQSLAYPPNALLLFDPHLHGVYFNTLSS